LIYYNTANTSRINSLGFAGGIYSDLSIAYAGIGNNVKCQQQSCPARLSTNPNSLGAFMACGTEQNDKDNAFFFRSHSDMYWIPTDTNKMKNVNGRIQIDSNGTPFMVGRKTLSNNYQTVSKIHNGPGFSFNFVDTNGQEKEVFNDFDVLVCDPNPACGK